MQKQFSKILLPVVFNRTSRWAVDKAVQLANKFGCDILLLHVRPSSTKLSSIPNINWVNGSDGEDQDESGLLLHELEVYGRSQLNDGLLIRFAILNGHWQTVLKDIIIGEHIDLVVIPKSHQRMRTSLLAKVNVNQLSQQTNCPILTVTRRFNVSRMHNIVVPVRDLVPVKKLTLAMYLSLETNSRIYLMGDNNKTPEKCEEYLVRAYLLLNKVGKLSVQCALRDNPDSAAGTLAYAKDVNADMIVINPGNESRLKGWWNILRGKYLCRESDIPVLTVAC
jgi:hypothetical protein